MRPENSWLIPRLRAALEMGKPPIGVVLNDPSQTEYTALDYKLAKAYHIREDQMVGGSIPIYWDQSDRVAFDVETVISKSKAAMERWEKRMEKSTTKSPGLMGYPVPRTTDGGPLPTLEEWAEEKARKRGPGKFGQGAGA